LERSRVKPNRTWPCVVFIDLDSTILRGPFESAVFPVVLAELAIKSRLDVKEARRQVFQEYLDRQKTPGIPAALAVDWDDILDTVAARLGVRLEARALEIANSHAGPPYSAVLDDAGQILRSLVSPQRAIVVATKGLRKYQLPVLDALGLTPLFTDILTPDVHHALKQEAAFYGHWPRSTRLQISVGDYYEDDVEAPSRFGFKTVWKLDAPDGDLARADPFDRPIQFNYSSGQTTRPDAIILSLHELPQVVRCLEQQALG